MLRNDPLKKILNNADIFAGFSGIILGLLITSLYFISKTIYLVMLGPALALASLSYLLLRNISRKNDNQIPKSRKTFLEILFFVFFSLSLLILFTHNNRPLSYFLLISICAGIAALSIFLSTSKSEINLQIFKIFLISFSLKSLSFFTEGSGIDYWGHLTQNNLLAQTGYIFVLFNKEKSFPLMHIQTAFLQIIANTPIKEATILAITLPLIISSICVFLVARILFNCKIGLLAMLIVNITDYMIYWGIAPQTTTFGVCLFYFLIFILIKTSMTKKNKILWSGISVIFFVSLVFSHAVSSFIFFVTLIGLFCGSYLYKALYDNRIEIFPPFLFIILFGTLMLQQWFVAIYKDLSGSSFFVTTFSVLNYYVTERANFLNRPETIVEYTKLLPPFFERVANTTGLALLMFLAAFGALLWLSKKYQNQFKFSMLTCSILLIIITFGFPLFGIRNIIPSRWFAFMYFFLSLMAACSVFFILTRVSQTRLKHCLLVFLIFMLTFFFISSTISNLDSPVWLKESTISTTTTFQESVGHKTISLYSRDIISSSMYTEQLTGYHQKVFTWRNSLYERPVKMDVDIGYYKLVQTTVIPGPEYEAKLEKMNRIYENDDLNGYYFM